MWQHRSHILTPLTEFTGGSKTKNFLWTKVYEKSFETTKGFLMRDIILLYTNFSKKFISHTDASKYQLGVVIVQEGKSISFFSTKLNKAQRYYTTTE